MPGGFRINAKNLFMTFAGTDELTTDMILNHLLTYQDRKDWKGIAVAKENYANQDGERDPDNLTHMHVLVLGTRKQNYTNEREFDFALPGTEHIYHPQLESVRSVKKAYDYIQKPDRLEYSEWGDMTTAQSDSLQLREEVRRVHSDLELMDLLIVHGKTHAYRFWKTYWEAWQAGQYAEAEVRAIEEFQVPPAVIRWRDTLPLLSLVLLGDAGMGKTSFARAILATMGSTLWATNVQDIRRYGGQDNILFDDCGVGSFSRSNIISLVDVEQQQSVRVLYGTAIIPAGTRRVFTANTIELLLGEHAVDDAIRRRIFIVQVRGFMGVA